MRVLALVVKGKKMGLWRHYMLHCDRSSLGRFHLYPSQAEAALGQSHSPDVA